MYVLDTHLAKRLCFVKTFTCHIFEFNYEKVVSLSYSNSVT